jgi:GTP cyclohydrolase IA
MQRHSASGGDLNYYNIENLFASLLAEIDPNPTREGLLKTPSRMASAWAEWTEGYYIDPVSLLKTFENGDEGMSGSYDSLVIVHKIPIVSTCEHHLAAILGYAHIGYLPGKEIVGLSKLSRVANAYARRLQVQERLTVQIADCIHDTLSARATGVLIRASHACMSTRGVRVHGSTTTTSAMRGELTTDASLRSEFLSLCLAAEQNGAEL